MATDVQIGAVEGELFADEDKTLRLEVLDANDNPVDVAGWTVVFDVRRKDNSRDPALLSKSASITGTFNATRTVNTQRLVVVVTDDEMHQFKGSNLPIGARIYRHSWKRTTSDNETVLCRGDFSPEKATAP